MVLPGAAALVRGLVAAMIALAGALWGWNRLRSAPEPPAESDQGAWVKPAYRDIADARLLTVALTLALVLAGLATTTWTPGRPVAIWLPVLSAWAVSAGVGTVAVLCDLRTTYLPAALLLPWAWLTAATVLILAGGTVAAERGRAAGPLLRLFACVAVARIAFWLWWRFGGGLGFGDVRLASILGADAAMVSVSTWRTWLVVGTVLGAAWAVVVALARRRRPSTLGSAFPYGPALAIGAWIALATG